MNENIQDCENIQNSEVIQNSKDIQNEVPFNSEDEKRVLSDYRKFSMMSKLKEQKNCDERIIEIDLR